MLVRIVLFLGLGLLLAGFGAAGWQYWQSLPQAQAVAAADSAPSLAPRPVAAAPVQPAEGAKSMGQTWLISAGGGLVPRPDVRNFLAQHKFDENRGLRFQFRAPLTDLLSPGEVLPARVYHQAFAETRAVAVATRLCEPLLQAWAAGCAVAEAELVKDSYDPETLTAEFLVHVVFSLKPDATPLPDLATRAFQSEYLRFDESDAFFSAATPQDFLLAATNAGTNACTVLAANGQTCRVMQMSLVWKSPEKADGHIEIGALGPLPKGVYPAPPL